MKRVTALIIALITTVSMTACHSQPDSSISETSSAENVSADQTDIVQDNESENQSQIVSEETSENISDINSGDESTESSEASKDVSKPTDTSDETSKAPEKTGTVDHKILWKSTARINITTSSAIKSEEYVTCSIQVIDPSGTYSTITDTKATIKVRGNSTSSGAKKPYNIKFSSKQDVLGMGKSKKWNLLANMYDKSLMRNKLAYDFAAEAGLAYTQQSTYADVYVNGKYSGNYQICESIGVGDSRVDIDITDNDFLLEFEPWPQYSNPNYIYTPVFNILFGFNDPEEPSPQQLEWLRTFLSKAEDALRNGNYEEVKKYWDVDSFVNDYIVHEYFKCVDAQTSSTRYYIKDGKIFGGPVWDFDLSSGNANPNYYTSYQNSSGDSTVGWWCNYGIWYKYFFQTDWFKNLVVKRFTELQPLINNLTDDNKLGKNRIDSLIKVYGESFYSNFDEAGWSVTSVDCDYERPTFSTYDEGIKYLRQWLRDRNVWMKKQWGIK